MSGLAAGVAIGVAGDAGVRAVAKQSKMYVGMVLILIFAEVRSLTPRATRQLRAPPCCTTRRSAVGAMREAARTARRLRFLTRLPRLAQALGLYGLIIGLIMTSNSSEVCGMA